MSLFTRRPRQNDDDPGDDDFDDFDDDFEEPPAPAPSAPAPELRPLTLREWEIPVAYAIAGLLVLLAILELTITTGPGAPANPNRILPLIGLVAAIALAATVRFKNRLVTSLIGVVGGVVIGTAKVPNALGILHTLGFLAPLVYAFLVTNRHNREQRALRASRNQSPRGGRRGSRSSAPEPAGPKANRRYTPPKARDPKADRGRRR